MQDIHGYSITGGGGGGRFYGGGIGGGGGGDRRMRVHQNNILNHHQSLKCPRCNSLNTKFCYYNNYNLSQPRHFCKNCRRYWTKGGVLRNVPVGGGCRKVKRSKSKQPSSSSSPSSADKPLTQDAEEKTSSSESSSLTAVKVPPSAFMGTDLPNLKLYENNIEWSTFLGQSSSDDGVFFSETTPFVFGGSVNQQCIDDQLKLEWDTVQGDRTVEINPSIGYEPLDWGGGGGGDQILFDLTGTVDHAYLSQSQWTSSDQDQTGLFLI